MENVSFYMYIYLSANRYGGFMGYSKMLHEAQSTLHNLGIGLCIRK